MPFFRVHQSVGTIDHELYRWPLTTAAAKVAIRARYQLLDYLYTSLWQQSRDGSPTTLVPLWFLYPHDTNTLSISTQFFFGDAILVSPVTAEGTSVTIYLPNDTFYDFWTLRPVHGQGHTTLTVPYTSIPLHIRSGTIIPLRADGANTTTTLRTLGFRLLIAPGSTGATGSLYLDDGASVHPGATSEISFDYSATNSTLRASGSFDYDPGVALEQVVLLGVMAAPKALGPAATYDPACLCVTYAVNRSLTAPFEVVLHH